MFSFVIWETGVGPFLTFVKQNKKMHKKHIQNVNEGQTMFLLQNINYHQNVAQKQYLDTNSFIFLNLHVECVANMLM